MAWRPKNLNEASYPVTILYAVIGYGIFQYPIGRQRVLFSRVYAIIIGSFYYFSLGYNLLFLNKLTWSRTEQKIMSIIFVINIGVAAMSRIIVWCQARTFSRMMKDLMNVDETLQKLGANINYVRTMNIGISVIIYWLITVIGLNCVSILGNFEKASSTIVMTYLHVIIINHASHINSLVFLHFDLSLRTVELRFYKLNELLKSESHVQQPRDDNPSSFRQYEDICINPTLRISSRRLLQAEENYKSLIQTVKHVHLELVDISKRIDKIYGVPMALTTVCFFVSSTGAIYDIIKKLTDSSPHGKTLAIFAIVCWNVVQFTNFMIINRSCEMVSAEAKRTGSLIHDTVNSSKGSELPNEIKQFSLQLMKNHVGFSPAGLFSFGYPLVSMLVQSIVTYVVILEQLKV